jgi:hypothetical protein
MDVRKGERQSDDELGKYYVAFPSIGSAVFCERFLLL